MGTRYERLLLERRRDQRAHGRKSHDHDAIVHVWEKAAEKSRSLHRSLYIVACERILLLARKIAVSIGLRLQVVR